jgi:hypothetical protein
VELKIGKPSIVQYKVTEQGFEGGHLLHLNMQDAAELGMSQYSKGVDIVILQVVPYGEYVQYRLQRHAW